MADDPKTDAERADDAPAGDVDDATQETGNDEQERGDASTDGDEATEDAAQAATAHVTVNPPKPSRAPLAIAMLALLLALGAAGLAAYLWMERTRDAGTDSAALAALDGTRAEIDRLSSQLAETERALQDMRGTAGQATANLERLEATLSERLRPLEAVPGRLSGLEASLAALQGISSGLRDTWLLAESEYYLQIANAQLQLAENVELARIALELADERLATLGNPALTDVRRAVADEMRKLDNLQTVDVEGASLELASLADAIDSLQLRNDIVAGEAEAISVDEELSGRARAMAALKDAMSGVISVRRSDAPVKPLLPPDAAYFLRNNLMLQIQTARLALLRGEQAVFLASLDDAAAWIREYYDPENRPVQSALASIDALRETRFNTDKPDISGSLARLRQFIALRAEERRSTLPDNGSAQ